MPALVRPAAIAALLFAAAGTALTAQDSQRVVFAGGADNAAAGGTVRGSQYRDHILAARAGQRMAVSLVTKGNAYFNVLPPGSTGEAIYNGSIDGNDATGIALPQTGDYRVRVYLMGAAKSGNRPVTYRLSLAITGAGGPDLAARCIAAVAKSTNRPAGTLSVLRSEPATGGGTAVFVAVPQAAAPWLCSAGADGAIGGVRFTGSEGAL